MKVGKGDEMNLGPGDEILEGGGEGMRNVIRY